MAATECTGPFTIVTGGAVERYRLVKLSTVSAVHAAAGDTFPNLIGRTNDKAASGEFVTVTPLSRGYMRMTAGAAISAGAVVYPAANGKISSTAASGSPIGVAMEAASGDNSEITVLVTT